MKNFTRLLAIIALTAVIGFTMTGCADPKGGLSDLKGDITIISMGTKVTTATTGTELIAAYSGTETISYQWYKDGVAIPDETNETYTPIEAGSYTVTVSAAGYNPKTSAAVTVTGETLLRLSGAISITPDSDVVVGDELEAVYTGDETVTYQWYKDGVAILDETDETYTPTEVGSYAVRVSADGYADKRSAPVVVSYPTPTAGDFAIGNLTQIVSNITAVTITPITGKSAGTITIYYNGSTTLPSVVGEYIVTFDVAAATGWNAATGLHVGTPLTIIDAIQYTITGSGTSFTATKDGETITNGTGTIQTVINAIRTDANGEKVAIQFGDGENDLDIGTATAAFNNTGGTWGDTIYLSGKITSANPDTDGTIHINSPISIISVANIANTGNDYYQTIRAIYNQGGTVTISGGTVSGFQTIENTGTLNIVGGTVSGVPLETNSGVPSGTIGSAVRNNGGTVTISGGILETTEDSVVNSNTVSNQSGSVTITGGTISAINGYAVLNRDTMTISGGTVTSTPLWSSAVGNGENGTLEISGTAHITSKSANANQATVVNAQTGVVNISGGTVENTSTGMAVRNNYTGKITISGDAVVNSKNTTNNQGTVVISNYVNYDTDTQDTDVRLEITGGTIHNTSTGNAVYNASTGAVTISGGTISTVSGFAVQSATTNTTENAGAITLGGNPTINGRIRPAAEGRLSVTTGFAPTTDKVYLDYAAYTDGMIVVTGGGNFLSKFALHSQPAYTLEASGGNLVVRIPQTSYVITGSGTSFTAVKSGETVGTGTIQEVITAIRTHANGTPAAIQFGTTGATTPLDIDSVSAYFNNNDGTWGVITLSGKITSANYTGNTGTVMIGQGVTVNSMADIATTTTDANGRAIYNENSAIGGTVTISGGTVSATNGMAVWNNNNGAITISGGKVLATGTTGRAVVNNTSGTITISGGTVSSTTREAVYNIVSYGTIIINGGTVSSTTGSAVSNGGRGTITISGTAVVTSENTSTGTIYLEDLGTDTADRLVITGGTVSNTASGGRAVYNASTGGVNISGGTVLATTGEAVYNYSTGTITVSGTADVTSENTSASSGTIYIRSSGTATTDRLTVSGGIVINTANDGKAVYNASTGGVNISNGTVTATGEAAVWNNSTGRITVSGTAQVTSNATYGTIHLASPGADTNTADRLVISGGIVGNDAYGGRAVYNESPGAVSISGGRVSATTGYAIYNNGTGTITVSGTAQVTSAYAFDTEGGTIFMEDFGTATTARLTISGGTVSNTSTTGNAVSNLSTGAVIISGGTISATGTGFAVQSTDANSAITLGGNPAITGSIRPSAAGKLSVVRTGTNPPPFNPTQTYTLDYAALATNGIAVVDGGTVSGTSFLSRFTLRVNGTSATLIANGANLVRQ